MRLSILAAALPVAYFLATGLWVFVAMIASLLFLLAVEFLNTAIERLCNHVQPDLHDAIKVTKDLGSAAVMFACFAKAAEGLKRRFSVWKESMSAMGGSWGWGREVVQLRGEAGVKKGRRGSRVESRGA